MDFKQSDLDNWSKDFRLMVEQDKRTPDQIRRKSKLFLKMTSEIPDPQFRHT